ncbi:hypothetical protein LX32DRAFT_98073 [Colletotrichum zoysiae]|uniref:Uncharacterized protein n=1 Tax=Colletotrichum zoysiae TaxID=1216348 RepID=A0AAD9M0C4_9PEZI|nr:hypothetical protein LX32DRAFT_98073 [Colletotrichum zoysiae]
MGAKSTLMPSYIYVCTYVCMYVSVVEVYQVVRRRVKLDGGRPREHDTMDAEGNQHKGDSSPTPAVKRERERERERERGYTSSSRSSGPQAAGIAHRGRQASRCLSYPTYVTGRERESLARLLDAGPRTRTGSRERESKKQKGKS